MKHTTITRGSEIQGAGSVFQAESYNGSLVTGSERTIEADGSLSDPDFRRYTLSEIGQIMKEVDGLNHSVSWQDHDFEAAARQIIDSGNYVAAVNLMDDGIREQLHADLAPCSDLEFLTAYMEMHYNQYGEAFTI